MILVIPTLEHKQAAMEYRQEWLEKEPDTSIHGSRGLHRYENYEGWLDNIEKIKTGRLEFAGQVPSTTYFGVYDNKIIGTIDIRNYLSEPLLIRGGHIGYGVRPSERRKGYATKMLTLALDECKKLGITKILVTCDKNNTASSKTIQKCGGVLENEFIDDGGGIVLRYWIEIN